MNGMVLWLTASTGMWFLMGGAERGILQLRGRYTDLRPFVKALKESGAQ